MIIIAGGPTDAGPPSCNIVSYFFLIFCQLIPQISQVIHTCWPVYRQHGLSVNTADIRKDPFFDQLSEADRCVSADICRKIEMLTSFCIGFNSIMIMTVDVQAPGKTINRLVRE